MDKHNSSQFYLVVIFSTNIVQRKSILKGRKLVYRLKAACSKTVHLRILFQFATALICKSTSHGLRHMKIKQMKIRLPFSLALISCWNATFMFTRMSTGVAVPVQVLLVSTAFHGGMSISKSRSGHPLAWETKHILFKQRTSSECRLKTKADQQSMCKVHYFIKFLWAIHFCQVGMSHAVTEHSKCSGSSQ